ncbi:DUF559 domain-containing protein [Micromonospora sp. NPDC051296]|uniref:DUF559 domain-containing protein n=1 Tax=Micromonospora sp. NPDC051296 TaxID=3155046 RepID=UPI003419144F
MVWIKHLHPNDVDRAVAAAPPDAPAVIFQRTAGSLSQSATVTSSLDEMEAVAGQLFPAWLPGADGIMTSAGGALAAVRSLAIAHAAGTAQYGPFLVDLAVGALTGRGPHTRRHQPEVRALGLARVLAAGFGRPTCALLLRPPDNLDEDGTLALVRAAQWLVDHGRLAVWISGGSLAPGDRLPEVVVAQPVREAPVVRSGPEARSSVPSGTSVEGRPRRERPAGRSRRGGRPGKPHPTSQVEVLLETALATRSWAAGRVWNHTVRPGPLVNPVRVDLLWKRERCVVEIDGDDHRAAGKYADDRNRDVMLQLNGYAVLRFTNTQVLDDIENVLALLFILLAEAAPVPNARLTQEHRCELKKGSREKLERLKLIEVERISGRLVLTLGEKGWAHCRTQLSVESVPPGSGAVGGALYAVLRRWGRFLTAQRLSLGEFVSASDAPTVTGTPDEGRTPVWPDVEERVRAAYQKLAPRAGDLVSLADLRDLVGDLTSADVDAALRRLHRRRGVTLVPEANQKTLDARTRAAAVVIGDQPKHSIAMEAS